MNDTKKMESKKVALKAGVVAWVNSRQLEGLPQGIVKGVPGLLDTMRVTVVTVDRAARVVTVRRGDGMLFPISPALLDAGCVHRFEGEKAWRPDSDPAVLAGHLESLYSLREDDIPDAGKIERLEWLILRNGGTFFSDNETNYRPEGTYPFWMVR